MKVSIALLVTCAGLLISSAALAQSTPPAADGKGSLAGPRVTDRDLPGKDPNFGEATEKARRAGVVQNIPQPLFMESIEKALGADAPDSVRASDELMGKIKQLSGDFQSTQRAYVQQHRDEIAELREKLGAEGANMLRFAGGGGGGRPAPRGGKNAPPNADAKPAGDGEMMPASQAPMPEADKAALLDKARELRDNAPKPQDLQAKIWAMLAANQQEALKTVVAATQEEQRQKRGLAAAKEQVARQLKNEEAKKNKAAADAAPANAATPAAAPQPPAPPSPLKDADANGRPARANAGPRRGAAAGLSPQQHERLMSLLARMTPEEREQLLARLEDRLKDRAPKADNTPDAPSPPPPPPAPATPAPAPTADR